VVRRGGGSGAVVVRTIIIPGGTEARRRDPQSCQGQEEKLGWGSRSCFALRRRGGWGGAAWRREEHGRWEQGIVDWCEEKTSWLIVRLRMPPRARTSNVSPANNNGKADGKIDPKSWPSNSVPSFVKALSIDPAPFEAELVSPQILFELGEDDLVTLGVRCFTHQQDPHHIQFPSSPTGLCAGVAVLCRPAHAMHACALPPAPAPPPAPAFVSFPFSLVSCLFYLSSLISYLLFLVLGVANVRCISFFSFLLSPTTATLVCLPFPFSDHLDIIAAWRGVA